jgi:hypothetical protein
MKRALLLLLNLICIQLMAQTFSWEWAKNAGGINDDFANSICTDLSGNVYVTGSFANPSAAFDSIILNSAGNKDVFIVKYNNAGHLLWVKSAGGLLEDAGLGICTNSSGNVYLTGTFRSDSITFDTITLANHAVTKHDIFIVKYDSAGNALWANNFGGSQFDYLGGIAADINDNILLTGEFNSPSIAFDTIILSLVGVQDLFITKFDPSGNVLWAKSARGLVNDTYVKTDKNGNVFLVGSFGAATMFDITDTLIPNGFADIFFAKYDSSGNFAWVHSYGGTQADYGRGLNIDTAGNIFIIGEFGSPSIIFDTLTINNAGGYDVFIAKFTESGNALWAKDIGGYTTDYSGGVTTDLEGNLYVTGTFADSILIFDTDTLYHVGPGWFDIFIAKYNQTGNLDWAKQLGDSISEWGFAIALDTNKSVFIAGMFDSFTPFDTITLNTNGQRDIYVAKLNVTDISTGSINYKRSIHNNKIAIYPNPTSSSITLESTKDNPLQSIYLYSMDGKLLKSMVDGQWSFVNIDLQSLSAGIYFLDCLTANGSEKVKVVKY